MIEYQFLPLDFPVGLAKRRERARFKSKWSQTLLLLEKELRHLNAKSIVLEVAVDESQIRQDGMLRADARPRNPAVVLSFNSKHGPLRYPCYRYDDWQDNLRAVALSLEALRTVDRYGVTSRAEQYRGWQQLPPPSVVDPGNEFVSNVDAVKFLKEFVGVASLGTTLDQLIRMAEKKSHPDTGGDPAMFKKVQMARERLLKK